jgi:hypothetical protein
MGMGGRGGEGEKSHLCNHPLHMGVCGSSLTRIPWFIIDVGILLHYK